MTVIAFRMAAHISSLLCRHDALMARQMIACFLCLIDRNGQLRQYVYLADGTEVTGLAVLAYKNATIHEHEACVICTLSHIYDRVASTGDKPFFFFDRRYCPGFCVI